MTRKDFLLLTCMAIVGLAARPVVAEEVCQENRFGMEQCTEYPDQDEVEDEDDEDEVEKDCQENRFGVCN